MGVAAVGGCKVCLRSWLHLSHHFSLGDSNRLCLTENYRHDSYFWRIYLGMAMLDRTGISTSFSVNSSKFGLICYCSISQDKELETVDEKEEEAGEEETVEEEDC